ncbi:carbohydrate ABC transporter permease [Phytohabitans suffuscus]|uniref:carbohydrate ABC transporter permease n=1 Tax=Phytohabitans suffuscus TaxID=624315 RepID=UPI001563A087|nr:ABC transporter permease subunit [Phytohabitans suffuscus]
MTIAPYIVSNVAAAVMFRIRFNPEFGLLNRTIQFFGFDGLPWLSDPKLAVGHGHLLSGVDRPAADDPAAARWAADHRHPHLDAARVDRAQPARYVAIPLIAPQIAISVIWQSYSVLTGLGVVLALTGGGPLKATQTLPMEMYNTAFTELRMNEALAIGTFILLLNVVLTLIFVGRLAPEQ